MLRRRVAAVLVPLVAPVPTCQDGGSLILEEQIEATASNPEGVTSAPVTG